MNNLLSLLSEYVAQQDCIIGICDATPLPLVLSTDTPFVSKDLAKRADPAANLPGAKSIIAIGVAYGIKTFPPMPENAGELSLLGVVEDYHVTVKKVLRGLISRLEQETKFKHKMLVDSPTLDERAIAIKAGLGHIGKHGLVISKRFGSRFNIGLLLTDIDFGNENNNPLLDTCPADCNLCIQACPTGALCETDGFIINRCISYLTQKNSLTPSEAKLLGRNLYGCDICQNACPKNQTQPIAWANPDDWLRMNDDEFKKAYGHTATLWQGTGLLKRNAKAVKMNLQALQAQPRN